VRRVATGGAETAEVDVRGFEIDAVADWEKAKDVRGERPPAPFSEAPHPNRILTRTRCCAGGSLSQHGLERPCRPLVAWARLKYK
jgi:hypothetical protein